MLKIRGPVVSKDLFWCLQFTLQVELHTGLSKTSASVGCGSHVRFVKLMTLHGYRLYQGKVYRVGANLEMVKILFVCHGSI